MFVSWFRPKFSWLMCDCKENVVLVLDKVDSVQKLTIKFIILCKCLSQHKILNSTDIMKIMKTRCRYIRVFESWNSAIDLHFDIIVWFEYKPLSTNLLLLPNLSLTCFQESWTFFGWTSTLNWLFRGKNIFLRLCIMSTVNVKYCIPFRKVLAFFPLLLAITNIILNDQNAQLILNCNFCLLLL